MPNNKSLFDPRLGKRPAQFAGRDDVLRDIRAALADPEEQYRTTILSGIKGSGKSSIISEVRSDPGSPGLVFVELKEGEDMPPAVSDARGAEAVTVYIVDDAYSEMKGLRVFLIDFSWRVHEGEDLKLILAGMPQDVDELLKDGRLAYLRRARRISLGNLRTDEVLALFERSLAGTGAEQIDGNVLRRAAEATGGYPYLVQLIGYYLSKEDKIIDDKAADNAIFLAKIELYKNIHEPLVFSLSSKDRIFLWAMAQDEGHTEFKEIAGRMGVSAGYASKYRERLIHAGVIYSSSYGELAFTLPLMKEYINKEYIERLGGEGGKRRL